MRRAAAGAGTVARACVAGCVAALALALAVPVAVPASIAPFTDDEVARILSLGPWPAPTPRDPTNRVSGQPAAIELGRQLFFDAGLSSTGTVSCATCHDPRRGFTDGLPRAQGIAKHDRNTQGLLDVALQRWFGWDGGADSLWAASIRPMLAPGEMGATPALVARRIRGDAALSAAYSAAFGSTAGNDDALLAGAGKAIAAFMETLRSARTLFDDFRDALERSDAAGIARYPADAKRGLKLFVGRGNCWMCHVGPAFSNGEFHDVGVPFVVEPGRVDPGRHAGIRRVLDDRFNLLGPHNDERSPGGTSAAAARPAAAPAGVTDTPPPASLKTATVRSEHRNWGEWRTPTLRGLSATAPYMHDGSLATLRDVVRHYSELNEDRLHADGEAILRPLRLDARETEDLLAFLRSLDPAPDSGR
jgi:cytochrome c peroxidase